MKNTLLNEHCAKNDSQKREDKIAMLTQQLNEIEEKMAQTEKEVSASLSDPIHWPAATDVVH